MAKKRSQRSTMKSPQEMLAELEDKFILGEILESDYRHQKKKLIQQLRGRGETIQASGNVQVSEVNDSLGMAFCHVPAGPFFFGPDDEFRELECTIYMSKYPVTTKEFMVFLEEADINYADEDLALLNLVSPKPECPVSHVSYSDAKEYCRWRRRVTNEYYSLPHEVEWEKAARGEDGRYYPWGNQTPTTKSACFQGDKQYDCTVPVTKFAKQNVSPYGCVDMVGNVWEWCLDSFDDERDPHLLRGGSWCNEVDYSNCVARTFSYPPTNRVDFGGFRLVYLPHDMLVAYRQAYADFGKATRHILRVVGLTKKTVKREKPVDKDKLAELSKALGTAAAKAAAEVVDETGAKRATVTHAAEAETSGATPKAAVTAAPEAEMPAAAPAVAEVETPAAPEMPVGAEVAEEDAIHDAMAQAISSAAAQFLRKGDEKDADTDDGDVGRQVGATPAKVVSEDGDIGSMPEPPPGVDAPRYKSIQQLQEEREETRTIEFDEEEKLSYEKAKPLKIPTAITYSVFFVWCLLLLIVIGLFAYKVSTF